MRCIAGPERLFVEKTFLGKCARRAFGGECSIEEILLFQVL